MTPSGHKRMLAIAVTVGLVIGGWQLAHLFRFFRIPSSGMEPTVPVGAHVLVRSTKDVGIGDILVFHNPLQGEGTYMKRIVAGPGDEVEIKDKRLFRNGREASEPYAVHADPVVYPSNPAMPEPYRSRDQYGPHRVPADSFFVLGDNRDRSSDSRYWGVVPRELVIGRVIRVFK